MKSQHTPAAMKTTRRDALRSLDGYIVGSCVVYYDDGTDCWYINHISDIDALAEYMDDPDIASDAYSHWCSGYPSVASFADQAEAEAFAAATATTTAPDLLVALENLVADWERVHGPVPEDHEARAAIAKAKGGVQ